jgi:hypothetical protein
MAHLFNRFVPCEQETAEVPKLLSRCRGCLQLSAVVSSKAELGGCFSIGDLLIHARFSVAESFGAPFAGVPIGGMPDVVTADACCKMHDDAAEDRSFHRRSCKREWSHPPTRACCIARDARRIARMGGSGWMSREPACAPTPTTSSAGKQRQASTSFVR